MASIAEVCTPLETPHPGGPSSGRPLLFPDLLDHQGIPLLQIPLHELGVFPVAHPPLDGYFFGLVVLPEEEHPLPAGPLLFLPVLLRGRPGSQGGGWAL